MVASNITGTGFSLAWAASTDNVEVTGYDVYLNGVFKISVTTATVNITDLIQNTTYSVTVKAKDAAGNVSLASTAVDVNTLDTEAPSAPSGLVAADITHNKFTLSWTESTDNAGVTGYEVYKDGVLDTTVATTTVEISGEANTTYSMTVKAKDAEGNLSAASEVLLVKTISTSVSNNVIQKFDVYPNPVVDHFVLSVSETVNISIVNVSGVTVYTGKINSGSNNVDIQLPSGVYLLKALGSTGNSSSVKLIVK